MTHSGNVQGLEEELLCPEEVEEAVCLPLSEVTAATSGEQTHHMFGFRFKRMNTGPNMSGQWRQPKCKQYRCI